MFPPGRYLVVAALAPLVGSDIVVIGHGAHIRFTSKGEYATLLSFTGRNYTNIALAADVLTGADSIQLASPLPEGAATLLRLNSSQSYFHTTKDSTRNNRMGELLTFASTADGGHRAFIEGKGPVFRYTANTTTATAIVPSKNVQVLGLAVTGAGAGYKTQAFNFDGVQGLRVSGCTLDAVNVGIGLGSSHQIIINGNSFSRIDMVGLGYSVMIGTFVLSVEVSGNTGSKGRHFVTTDGEDGIARGITISSNRFSGSIEGAISPHAQGYDVAIMGNHISDSNIGICSRCPNTVIAGNTIVNIGQPNSSVVAAPLSMQISIYSTELGGTNLIVKDNVITYDVDRCRGTINRQPIYGASIDIGGLVSDDGHVEFANEYVTVEGNTVSPIGPGGGAGIAVGFSHGGAGQVIDPASASAPEVLRIERNTIVSPTRYSQISVTGSVERTRAVITGNTLHAAGAAALTAASLRSLIVQGNAFSSAGTGGLMAYTNISSMRVAGNELAAEVDGCVVASLSNVTAHAVQAWGCKCASGVVIPTPHTADGAALEVTVWEGSGDREQRAHDCRGCPARDPADTGRECDACVRRRRAALVQCGAGVTGELWGSFIMIGWFRRSVRFIFV